jgi:hypothetical protein
MIPTVLKIIKQSYPARIFPDFILNTQYSTELLGLFWTLSIVLYVEDKRPQLNTVAIKRTQGDLKFSNGFSRTPKITEVTNFRF